jgi:ABC-type lipoprotein release transport system permease subunit
MFTGCGLPQQKELERELRHLKHERDQQAKWIVSAQEMVRSLGYDGRIIILILIIIIIIIIIIMINMLIPVPMIV